MQLFLAVIVGCYYFAPVERAGVKIGSQMSGMGTPCYESRTLGELYNKV